MKKSIYALSLVVLMVLSYLAGGWNSAPTAAAGAPKILYYVDPMHPAYKSDKPGIAPDCGMKLEAVYADGAASPDSENEGSLSPGTVRVSPEKQQVIGVQVGLVEESAVNHVLRTTGRVEADEEKIVRVTAADGWIEKIYPNSTGTIVKKGQLLASFYSKEFIAAELAYLYTKDALDRSPRERVETNPNYVQVISAERELQSLGMSPEQMQEIIKNHRAVTDIELRAPMTGFVLARNISAGMRFNRETELFRIADLSRVWIVADLFENEARYFKPGMTVKAILPYGNQTFAATVSDILPQFDGASRTLKVRLEADNPGFALRPDMFVDVELPVHMDPALVVPVDAIVDSGLEKRVFVDRSAGVFEPRRIETGWRLGGKAEVKSGLAAGERIVTSGTFLIDSESRMNAAAAGIFGATVKDPVCGMDLDKGKAEAGGRKMEYGGATHYFCSEDCELKFAANPGQYWEADSTAGGIQGPSTGPHSSMTSEAGMNGKGSAAAVVDTVCGMSIDPKQAAGRSIYQGDTHYFCSEDCKTRFDADPKHYVPDPAGTSK